MEHRHHLPWDGWCSGCWCPRTTLRSGDVSARVLPGEANRGVLSSSSDDIAVLHPATALPEWSSR